ncbi:prepilin peptidase-dependent pilin [Candidatus Fukatsuia symbiotica]|uniref:Prepilin peptidase-dependent pilin n=1 Tax=Candidatus Fukatsuia symbiotica TaxID=1878942 RepID=A0A2U8I747_9GAMM|nr:prepilin peptidase-dependent pilin [Candidatus Fukatsuia symbiotica]AWK14927.1 prepilin peptidase-dependent pilin [Candidatus Fukatsuia symbiotica]MEA9445283.1 prepilin peptidase-dependent pilin [Candidatus Fukatsuia symbiotica]
MTYQPVIYQQRGFTLIELMVAVAIIAVLSSIGIPSYQRYVQKAALTDMLQAIISYKTAIELCFFEKNSVAGCNTGVNGIPAAQTTRYVKTIEITRGIITLSGQQLLDGLTIVMTPTKNSSDGLSWARTCTSTSTSIVDSCKAVFRFL